jgi:chromosome segregation ATPase
LAMGARAWLRLTGVILAALLCAAVGFLAALRWAVRSPAPASELRRLQSENQALQRQIRHLRSEAGARTGAPPAPPSAPPASGPAPQLPPGALEAIRSAATLQDKLAAAAAALEQLQLRKAELEARLEVLAEESRSLAEREQAAREALEGTRRLVEALQTEVRAKQDRLESLESSYRTLRRQKEEAEQRLERSARILAELEEINRRRDTHLTLLLRRYRDLTEQYRNLAARLESPGESVVSGSGELSRIQNLVSLAEEDLRQLQGLNAQAQALHKQLR